MTKTTDGHNHDYLLGHKRAFTLSLVITSTVLIAELIGAWISGSLGLLADAGHMFTDVIGLSIALVGTRLMDALQARSTHGDTVGLKFLPLRDNPSFLLR